MRIKLLKPLFFIAIATNLFILTALFLLISPVYAQDNDIGESHINPASPLYFLKSVREALELKFAGTTRIRALRELEFSTRRIREVKSLVKTPRQDLIEPTIERYLFHLRELAGIVNPKDENLVAQVTEAVTLHMNVLQTVYGQIQDPRALMSIRAAVNRLSEWEQEFIDKLDLLQPSFAQKVGSSKLLGCNFLSKEASTSATLSAGSSSLNEVEKAVFAERAGKCLQGLKFGKLL